MVLVEMACLCSCIWGRPDPGPVRLQDMQQVTLDTKRTGMAEVYWCIRILLGASASRKYTDNYILLQLILGLAVHCSGESAPTV